MISDVVSQAAQSSAATATGEAKKTSKVKGRTIGSPELSEKAQEYYEKLKKKYGDMDFILVDKENKDNAEANAGRYAAPGRTVVLIDEEKIEKMASDESYRKKYEGIISNARSQIKQMQKKLLDKGSSVKSYGMKIDDGGNASFFAVVDKSLAAQRERIADKKAQRAEDKKKADKEARNDKLEEIRTKRGETSREEDLVTVTAGSVDELVKKINDTLYESMSDSMMTEEEKLLGSRFDMGI